MNKIMVSIQSRVTLRYKVIMRVLLISGKLRLMNLEQITKVIDYASSKGWLLQFRLDGGAWENIMFGVGLVQGEDRTQHIKT